MESQMKQLKNQLEIATQKAELTTKQQKQFQTMEDSITNTSKLNQTLSTMADNMVDQLVTKINQKIDEQNDLSKTSKDTA